MGNAFETGLSHLHPNWALNERRAPSTSRVSTSRNICCSSTRHDCTSQSMSPCPNLTSTWGELPRTTAQSAGSPHPPIPQQFKPSSQHRQENHTSPFFHLLPDGLLSTLLRVLYMKLYSPPRLCLTFRRLDLVITFSPPAHQR